MRTEPYNQFWVGVEELMDSRPDLIDALATKARLEAVLWTAMDAIITIDEGHRIVFFNPAAEEMFGLGSNEAIGQPIERFIPERFRKSHGTHISRFGETGATGRRMGALGAISALRLEGVEFPVEASISQAVVGGQRYSTVILRDVTERLANEEVRLLLAREVDHRAKNALALVQALVSLTRASTHEAFVEAVEGRVAALARAHSLLARNQWSGGNMRQIIREEVAAYVAQGQVVYEGPDVLLAAKAVQPISLLLHELATNAVKYGALSVPEGRLHVSWSVHPTGEMALEWRELGGPAVSVPKQKGFGSTLISTVTARQLNGSVNVTFDPAGIIAKVRLPAEIVRPARGEPAESREKLDSAVEGTEEKSERGKILVVEDEVLIAMQMAEVLSEAGWDVIGPATGIAQALSLLTTQGPPDVAVLDVNLDGEMVGPLAENLRGAGIPVVLCTGYETLDDVRLEGCPMIRKPANIRQLLAGIKSAMSSQLPN
jgi:PAS domain S-box-containing protein